MGEEGKVPPRPPDLPFPKPSVPAGGGGTAESSSSSP